MRVIKIARTIIVIVLAYLAGVALAHNEYGLSLTISLIFLWEIMP